MRDASSDESIMKDGEDVARIEMERKTMICQENRQGNCRYLCLTAQRHGAYRDIFKKFKGSFEKIFITGVSPVTLDDVNTNDQG